MSSRPKDGYCESNPLELKSRDVPAELVQGDTGLPPVTLVVLELGARWPLSSPDPVANCELITIAQQPGEELLRRTWQCLHGLERQGRPIAIAIYCLSPLPEAIGRVALAAALLRCVSATGDALVVDASTQPAERRHEIVGWLSVLAGGLAGSRIAVDVCFASQRVELCRRPGR